MSCVTTMYLDDDRYAKLVEKLRGVDWLSLEGPRGRRDYDGMQLAPTTTVRGWERMPMILR